MAEVQQRLQERFPDLDQTVVEAAIQVAAAGITGPVRDFVPLLVERAARIRLQGAVDGGIPNVDRGGPGRHFDGMPKGPYRASSDPPQVDVL